MRLSRLTMLSTHQTWSTEWAKKRGPSRHPILTGARRPPRWPALVVSPGQERRSGPFCLTISTEPARPPAGPRRARAGRAATGRAVHGVWPSAHHLQSLPIGRALVDRNERDQGCRNDRTGRPHTYGDVLCPLIADICKLATRHPRNDCRARGSAGQRARWLAWRTPVAASRPTTCVSITLLSE
jgi:hypothetical protein